MAAYTNESRSSFDSTASGVFYTQQHINFNDLVMSNDPDLKDQEEFYPQFIQYYQERDSSRPSVDYASFRRGPRASLASLSHTLKRGKG